MHKNLAMIRNILLKIYFLIKKKNCMIIELIYIIFFFLRMDISYLNKLVKKLDASGC